jgi:hypothetical protein
MTSAAEARYRIQQPLPTTRAVVVLPLDAVSERVTSGISRQAWNGVTFLKASDIARFETDVATTDLVMMVVAAGTDPAAVATIGEICSERRIPTAACVIRDASTPDADLSVTLGRIRPWSLMVVVASDRSYLEDILRSFR